MLLITGAAGFIGGNFVHHWFERNPDGEQVVVVDKLTYAGHLLTIRQHLDAGHAEFVRGDVADREVLRAALARHQPSAVLHFAAESHVDRSIQGPSEFVHTNLVGTFSLLEETRAYWHTLDGARRDAFRLLYVSTDEVYGSLEPHDPPFHEGTPYAPRNPYAASKAGADHLVHAYHHTYGLPTLTTHCTDNYGPYHFPEKLIPVMILNALSGKPLPLYGDGQQVRDWLYVRDHCEALCRVLESGTPGGTYNIGGRCERRNIDVVTAICRHLDTLRPRAAGRHEDLITFVADRPGHDRRYAIDPGKLERETGWRPRESFETGIAKTIDWYLSHGDWVNQVRAGHPEGDRAARPTPARRTDGA